MKQSKERDFSWTLTKFWKGDKTSLTFYNLRIINCFGTHVYYVLTDQEDYMGVNDSSRWVQDKHVFPVYSLICSMGSPYHATLSDIRITVHWNFWCE